MMTHQGWARAASATFSVMVWSQGHWKAPIASRNRMAATPAASPMNGAKSQTVGCRLSRNCLRLGMVQRLAVARSLTRLSAIRSPGKTRLGLGLVCLSQSRASYGNLSCEKSRLVSSA
jgi:hypothetical protein